MVNETLAQAVAVYLECDDVRAKEGAQHIVGFFRALIQADEEYRGQTQESRPKAA